MGCYGGSACQISRSEHNRRKPGGKIGGNCIQRSAGAGSAAFPESGSTSQMKNLFWMFPIRQLAGLLHSFAMLLTPDTLENGENGHICHHR